MVNNPALWFVNGVIATVVVHTAWKFFMRFWSYESDIAKLNLRISDLQRDLEDHKCEDTNRRNTNFQMLYNMINSLSTTVTTRLNALEYKKTK